MRPGWATPAPVAKIAVPATATETPVPGDPSVVPGYEVQGELGRGGMGVVYLARDTRLDRPVALKMILAGGHAGEAERARFRGEAEAAARLQHPDIVQIHEVGEHDGRPFLSLEYVAGGGLDRQVAGAPQPPRRAAELVARLARAMQHAHEHGVVHRDLKPANVLLGEPGRVSAGRGEPHVSDFGLAKRLDVTASLTPAGAVVGTQIGRAHV